MIITLSEKSAQNVLFVDQMMVGETVRIDLSRRSCFDGHTYKLSITKLIKDYEVIYNEKTSIITLDKFKLIQRFEKELRKKHSSNCSIVDQYLITNTTTHETLKVIDESCAWNGFLNLIEKLEL